MSYMFFNCAALKSAITFTGFGAFRSKGRVDVTNMFEGCIALRQTEHIRGLSIESVAECENGVSSDSDSESDDDYF